MFTKEVKGPYSTAWRCPVCNHTKTDIFVQLEKWYEKKVVCIKCGAFEQWEKVVARKIYSKNCLSLEHRSLRIEVDRVLTK